MLFITFEPLLSIISKCNGSMDNKRILFIIFTFYSLTLLAQQRDTIFVQTLTYDSSGRNGFYSFPEASDGPFEKILMYYSMRCHDAAVGSGNVGCREWDYSCNTFVLDSSRMDSSLSFHSSYQINNFKEDYFTWSKRLTHHLFERYHRWGEISGGKRVWYEMVGDTLEWSPVSSPDLPQSFVWVYNKEALIKSGLSSGDEIYGVRLPLDVEGEIEGVYIGMKWLTDTLPMASRALLPSGYRNEFFGKLIIKNGTSVVVFPKALKWDGSSTLSIRMNVPVTKGKSIRIQTISSQDLKQWNSQGNQQSIWFTGAQWVDLPIPSLQTVDSAITISFWSYGFPPLIPGQNTTLLEGVDSNKARQINIHLPWSDGKVYWDCGGDTKGFDRIQKKASAEDTKGKWNHWAFVKDVKNGDMMIYLNGELWQKGEGKARSIGSISSFVLGMNEVHNTHYNGRLRDFAIWNEALSPNEILNAMYSPLASHSKPILYYSLRDGTNQLKDLSGHQYDVELRGLEESYFSLRLVDHFIPKKDTKTETNKAPKLQLLSGNLKVEEQKERYLDTLPNLKHMVIRYVVNDHQVSPVDTQYLYNAVEEPIYDESGEQIDYLEVDSDGDIEITKLKYYTLQPAQFELLSLVTPYGNGLDLGPNGVRFTFDVSDFAPILQGNKRIAVKYGAWQEELDIRFAFIKGTPARKVLNIQNVWPHSRGYYSNITRDDVFEPRSFKLGVKTDLAKVRMTITGHQQNGEFVKQNHYLNVNGGDKEFNWDVWKECSTVPIHPQGGTWLLDRAGWCPGDPSLVTYHTITPQIKPNQVFTLDYGVNGVGLKEANYLVSSQLIEYGPPLKNLDAEITQVVRPSKRVEYLRYNPDCVSPEIVLTNTGATVITSLSIRYGVKGGIPLLKQWKGKLENAQTIHISLPISVEGFWASAIGQNNPIFKVELVSVNGKSDDYSPNDIYEEPFELPDIIDKKVIRLEYKTNTRGGETYYTITDRTGNVLYEADQLEDNTGYKDLLELKPGCYSLLFNDRGDDGLYFWFWERVDPRGRGFAKLNYERTPGRWRTLTSFNADFGRFFKYDFAFQSLTATKEPSAIETLVSIWPNPVVEVLNLRLYTGQYRGKATISLIDVMGKEVYKKEIIIHEGIENNMQTFVGDLPSGIYQVKIKMGNKWFNQQVVKM